jgi:hypothetical protein
MDSLYVLSRSHPDMFKKIHHAFKDGLTMNVLVNIINNYEMFSILSVKKMTSQAALERHKKLFYVTQLEVYLTLSENGLMTVTDRLAKGQAGP